MKNAAQAAVMKGALRGKGLHCKSLSTPCQLGFSRSQLWDCGFNRQYSVPEIQPGEESSWLAWSKFGHLGCLRDKAGRLRAQALESDQPGFDPFLPL